MFCLALVAWDEDCHEVKLAREELVEALREQDQTLCPVLASAKKLAELPTY